jgi:hypothetical protein
MDMTLYLKDATMAIFGFWTRCRRRMSGALMIGYWIAAGGW